MQNGRALTNAAEFGALLSDTSLGEEGDEGLVGGLNEHELERVAVEGNAFERAQDGVEDSATGNLTRGVNRSKEGELERK